MHFFCKGDHDPQKNVFPIVEMDYFYNAHNCNYIINIDKNKSPTAPLKV